MSLHARCRVVLMAAAVALTMSVPASAASGTGRDFTVRDAMRVVSLQEQEGGALHVSPDGRKFFLVEAYGDLEDDTRVFTLKVFDGSVVSQPPLAAKPAAAVSLRTATNQDAISAARWTPAGDAIVFLGVDGAHAPQPFRFDVDRGSLERLVSGAERDVVAFDAMGDVCVFMARVETPAEPAPGWTLTDQSVLQLLFPEEANEFHEYALFLSRKGDVPRRITPAVRSNYAPYGAIALSPDGRQVVASLPPPVVPQHWRGYPLPAWAASNEDSKLRNLLQFHVIDLATGRIRPLVDAPLGYMVQDFSPSKAVWSRDGRKVFLANSMPPPSLHGSAALDRPVVLEVDVEDPDAAPQLVASYAAFSPGERFKSMRLPEDGAVLELETHSPASPLSSTGGRIGRQRLLRFSATPQGWRLAVARELEHLGGVQLPEGRLWISESANQPPRLWARPRGGTADVELLDFNPQLRDVNIRPIAQVRWKDREGHPWSGGLVLPHPSAGGGRPPLIVALKFHDPSRFRPDGPYTTAFATQALAARGFAVLELDSFDATTTGTEREGPMQMRAVESAVDFAAEVHGVDPGRVGLIGFSRTSYHVVYTLVNSRKRFAAAIVSDGVDGGYVQYQLFTLNHYGGSLGQEFASMQGGPPFGPGLDRWRRKAAMFNLDRINAPLRIEMIGQSSVLQEWELYSSLKLMRKPVEAFWIPRGTHVLVKPRERYLSQQGTVDWLEFWIHGRVPDGSADPGRPARWQALQRLSGD